MRTYAGSHWMRYLLPGPCAMPEPGCRGEPTRRGLAEPALPSVTCSLPTGQERSAWRSAAHPGGMPADCQRSAPATRLRRGSRGSPGMCGQALPRVHPVVRRVHVGPEARERARPRLQVPRALRKRCASVAHVARPIGRHRRPEQTQTCADRRPIRRNHGFREVSGRSSRHRLLWWNCTVGWGLMTADN